MKPTDPLPPSAPADPSPGVVAPPVRTPTGLQPTTDQVTTPPEDAASAVGIPADGPRLVGRCRVEAEIGRGGMGVVVRAADPVFGRQLAVKILQARADERPDLARRFLDEARLTGRLQHPGIPPVHEQGTLDDGRPYFTMKLIQGDTLEALLKARSDPLESLSRFINIFAQVCQTVAYTHSQGVIHRDLKPANVMVGAFGEVQVMDWGLARALGAHAETDAPPTPAGDGDEGHTRAGQALGTPAYMPPEQARGEHDQLDERADVFGLGAILCFILTGQAPFQGSSVREVLRQAQQGDLSGAYQRLDASGADAALIALGRACLSPEPSQRPRDAGEVATATARFLEGVQERFQRAEQERAAAVVKAVEERKRRRVQSVLALLVVATVVAGGGTWLWLARQRAAARGELTAVLERSAQALAAGNLTEALAAARQGQGLLPAVGDDPGPHQAVTQRLQEVEFVGRLEKIRTPESASMERFFSRARTDARYAQAFRDLEIDIDALAPEEAARRIAARPALKPYLIAALDDWVAPRRQARPGDLPAVRRLLQVARLVDPDAWRNDYRAAASRDDLAALEQMAATVDVRGQTTSALLALAERLGTHGRSPAAVALLRRAQDLHPEDFWLHYYQGWWSWRDLDPDGLEEATRSYAAAIALRPRFAPAWASYASVLADQGRVEEALAAARRAVDLPPDNAYSWKTLAGLLERQGDRAEVTRTRCRAIELLRKHLAQDPKDDDAVVELALQYEKEGDNKAALEGYREAAQLSPRNAFARRNIGILLDEAGKPREAIPWLEEATRLLPDTARFWYSLGRARQNVGDLAGAEQAYRKAIEVQPYELKPYESLADVLQVRGAREESQAICHLGIRRCADVLRKYPRHFQAERLTGAFLYQTGDLVEAVKHIRKALEINPLSGDAFAALSRMLNDLCLLDEALEVTRQGCRQAPVELVLWNNLAVRLCVKGEPTDEAYQAIQRALSKYPNDHRYNYCKAWVLQAQGKFDASLEAYQHLDQLQSRTGAQTWPTGEWVQEAARKVELDRSLAAVETGERPVPDARTNLQYARLCLYKQNYAAAARFYETAFALDRASAERPAEEPGDLDELDKGQRCHAALAAAWAGAGRGQDAPTDAAQRSRWRRQALAWLRADLEVWQQRAAASPGISRLPVLKELNYWRTHDAFLGVRDRAAREQLPTDERDAWQRFWADVAVLHARVTMDIERTALTNKTLEPPPAAAVAHYERGRKLADRKDYTGASAAYSLALEIQPRYPLAHNELGNVLLCLGRFDEALASYRHALELSGFGGPWRAEREKLVTDLERLAPLVPRLPAFLAGAAKPANADEALDLAQLCAAMRRYTAATRFYRAAFAATPALADDRLVESRTTAAGHAALAAAGKDSELATIEIEEWGYLTGLAHGWLQANLDRWKTQADDPKNRAAVRDDLRKWKQDADLASLRDPAGRAAMPELDRQRWTAFWADVDALLARVVEGEGKNR